MQGPVCLFAITYLATGLKRCSSCHNVQKSNCTKAGCRGESGEKPKMECVIVPTTSSAKTTAKRKITLPAKKKAAISSEDESEEEAFDTLEEISSDEDGHNDDDDQLSEVTDDEEEEEKEEDNLEPGYYIVYYKGELFPGKFDGKKNETKLSISCMQKASIPGSTWKWPSPLDEHEYL